MINIQNSLEKKFADFIAKRNTDKYIKKKVSFSFLALMVLGIICGIAVFDSIYRSNIYNAEHVLNHFDNALKNCVSFSDYFSEILNVSKSDLRNLLFIFISGFTYFCFPLCGIMVFSKGFLNGFATFYLIEIFRQIEIQNESLMLFLFIAFKIFLSIISIYLAMTSYVFSYKFREIKSNCSILRRAPIAYRYIFIFIYSVGGVLLTNYIYYFCIYNLIK